MGSAARALGLGLVAATLAAGCVAHTRTRAEDLAWARWKQCDRFPSVTLMRITPEGELDATATVPDEFKQWEACILVAHREQIRQAAATRPPTTFAPVDSWTGTLCRPGARAVRTPYDGDVIDTYERIAAIAHGDLPRDRSLVIVDDLRDAAGLACGDADAFTIAVNAQVLHEMREWPARRVLLARLIAHEVAHVALGHLRRPNLDLVAMEREADELAAFYLERAGIPCRDWVDVVGIGWWSLGWPSVKAEREAISAACELARRGERPPRRTSVTKQR
jgi:hypothetical protein